MSEERERCPVCGKARLRCWSDAVRLSRHLRKYQPEARGVEPYWSRKCHCYHIGTVSTSSRKRARRKNR